MWEYIKKTRRRYLLFGILESIGIFFLVTALGLFKRNVVMLLVIIFWGSMLDSGAYKVIEEKRRREQDKKDRSG